MATIELSIEVSDADLLALAHEVEDVNAAVTAYLRSRIDHARVSMDNVAKQAFDAAKDIDSIPASQDARLAWLKEQPTYMDMQQVNARLTVAPPTVEKVSEGEPDFTIIPEALAKFAQDEESAAQFRARLKGFWQRFGIEDGKNFPGGGEALSGGEKITMREIDIVLNSDEGKAAGLLEWMKADTPQD